MSIMHRCSEEQWTQLLAALRERHERDEAEMPDDRAALLVMFRGFDRLRQLGWRDACYCPKDGSTFEVIEAGSTGIHRAHYEGEWPKGTWWIHEDGDLWPSRPILFRLIPPAAPCDESPKGEDATAAEGRSPASAVGDSRGAHD